VAQRRIGQKGQQANHDGIAEEEETGKAQAPAFGGLVNRLLDCLTPLDGVLRLALVLAQPWLHHALGDDGRQQRQEKRRDKAKEVVGRDAERDVWVGDMDRLVGDLGQHGVKRRDQQVGGEGGPHAGIGRRQPG
jgi:hypothetical protein